MWFGAMMLWMVAFWVGVVVLGVWLASLLFPASYDHLTACAARDSG